jgi:hypothetical protein
MEFMMTNIHNCANIGNSNNNRGGFKIMGGAINFGSDTSFLVSLEAIKRGYPNLSEQEQQDKYEQIKISLTKFPEDTLQNLLIFDARIKKNLAEIETKRVQRYRQYMGQGDVKCAR